MELQTSTLRSIQRDAISMQRSALRHPDSILRCGIAKKRLMKRIFLVSVTNLAVVTLLSTVIFMIERLAGTPLSGNGLGGLMLFSLVFGFGGALISLALSKWLAKRAMGVRVLSPPNTELEIWLVETVKRLADRAGIGMPEVGIFEAEDMNAFATGARRDAALIAVSAGLLRNMRRPAIEAVLGHEISHVANGDMVTLTLMQGILNTFVIFMARVVGKIVDGMIFKNDSGESGMACFVATMLAQLVLGIAASMVMSWYSRHREFRADRGGADLAGRANMVAALECLAHGHGETLPPQLQAFGINTGAPQGFMRLFQTHPPLADRIAALGPA
jgi:heat shock protein HtpX